MKKAKARGRSAGAVDSGAVASDAPDATMLTVDQVRRELNISDWFARRLIRDHELPAIMIAHNCIRVQLGDLRAFIDARRTNRKS